jgi:hypothetical protein
LAHGAGQPAGGVKLNSFGEKSAKVRPAYSGTTHGVVLGTATGGSATAVFDEPTVGAPSATPSKSGMLPAAASRMERGRAINRDRTRHLQVGAHRSLGRREWSIDDVFYVVEQGDASAEHLMRMRRRLGESRWRTARYGCGVASAAPALPMR